MALLLVLPRIMPALAVFLPFVDNQLPLSLTKLTRTARNLCVGLLSSDLLMTADFHISLTPGQTRGQRGRLQAYKLVGFMNQTLINMVADDGVTKLRGNPAADVVYTRALADNRAYTQVVEHNFKRGDLFCFPACDLSRPNDAELCQHIFDPESCGFNGPSNIGDSTLESCAGDSQTPQG
ncbi:hypothetical protein HYPSUDRAFT_201361 [Hypholoma sublateritium FD-334 SS-4]|uniref:HNH nuclease domain-containing protein n=1 Tax=Hypholoma sublateritium (strain FD-334 SS-4) TaxID=945553 RepID=A0A0D2L815_HYPSF|nr:hypothetical protein HYPSUDRAFT_201361 [Hypholoma sublateritium FD-334 SS-4]